MIFYFTVLYRVSQTFNKTLSVALIRSSILKMAEGHNTAISTGSALRNRLFIIRHGEVRTTRCTTASDASVKLELSVSLGFPCTCLTHTVFYRVSPMFSKFLSVNLKLGYHPLDSQRKERCKQGR